MFFEHFWVFFSKRTKRFFSQLPPSPPCIRRGSTSPCRPSPQERDILEIVETNDFPVGFGKAGRRFVFFFWGFPPDPILFFSKKKEHTRSCLKALSRIK